jgi:hypothetical protein
MVRNADEIRSSMAASLAYQKTKLEAQFDNLFPPASDEVLRLKAEHSQVSGAAGGSW